MSKKTPTKIRNTRKSKRNTRKSIRNTRKSKSIRNTRKSKSIRNKRKSIRNTKKSIRNTRNSIRNTKKSKVILPISSPNYRMKVELPEFMNINDSKLPYNIDPFWKDSGITKFLKSLFGFESKDDEDVYEWISHREKMIKNIDKFRDVMPLGTKLYHGTSNSDLKIENLENHMTFLGLEPLISIWYTAEEIGDYENQKFGYVYEFEVIKPITVNKLIKYISFNPKGCDICTNGGVCVHPQITMHTRNLVGPFDFSVEVTLMLKKMIEDGYLSLTNKYRTSIVNLYNMENYPLSKLDLHLHGDLFILWPKDKEIDLNYVEGINLGRIFQYKKP